MGRDARAGFGLFDVLDGNVMEATMEDETNANAAARAAWAEVDAALAAATNAANAAADAARTARAAAYQARAAAARAARANRGDQ